MVSIVASQSDGRGFESRLFFLYDAFFSHNYVDEVNNEVVIGQQVEVVTRGCVAVAVV